MPNIYVRSTDGSDVDDGSTWALAKATLLGAAAIDAAGDTIYLSNTHSESTAASVTISLAGTITSPVSVLCSSDSLEPPTSLATSGSVTTTGTSSLTISGSAYIYGLIFNCGTGAGNPTLSCQGHQIYEQCKFNILAGSGAGVDAGLGDEGYVTWINCGVSFSHSVQGISVTRASFFVWRGGSVLAGSTAQSTLIRNLGSVSRGSILEISGVDLSNMGASCNLVTNAPTGAYSVIFRNCRLPAAWSGNLFSGTVTDSAIRAAMYNCDATDTNYRLWVEDYAGSTRSETSILRTNGASDGTTPISWKMTSSANAEYPLLRLESPEIVQWNETTGTSLTVSVEIVHDSQGAGSGSRFQNDEIWLEVMYLGTSGFPLGTWITDCKADVLAVAANQDDSSWTWSTPGMTAPVRQKLAVTFTAQEKGFIHARIVLAKASKTVYVCPKLTVL